MAVTQSLFTDLFGVAFKGRYSQTDDFGTTYIDVVDSFLLTLGSGTGSGQANAYFRKQYTIPAATVQTINLKSLVDPINNTITSLSALKGLIIRLYSSTDAAAIIKVGGTGSGNNFTAIFADSSDKIPLGVNGVRFFGEPTAGYTVDATHRNLDIENMSATQSAVVDVRIIGVK